MTLSGKMAPVDEIGITVLVDDKGAADLPAEHGFSLWIEAGGLRILFDTGQGKTLPRNARHLGAGLEGTDFLVLSHGHYDHTGGITEALRSAPFARLVLHPAAVIPRYSIKPAEKPRRIGMPRSSCSELEKLRAGRILWATRTLQLAPGIGVTGPIPRETTYEDTGGPFFLDPRGERKDPIEDDQALWIETPEGMIICVGCSHAGLINTLNYVRKVSGISYIRAVIGGYHLLHASDERLGKTLDALRLLSPGMLVPCHCTGEKAILALTAAFGKRVSCCHTGMEYHFA